jgi:hypothetical protein
MGGGVRSNLTNFNHAPLTFFYSCCVTFFVRLQCK